MRQLKAVELVKIIPGKKERKLNMKDKTSPGASQKRWELTALDTRAWAIFRGKTIFMFL